MDSMTVLGAILDLAEVLPPPVHAQTERAQQDILAQGALLLVQRVVGVDPLDRQHGGGA